MEKISLPVKIDIKENGDNQGTIIIGPCYPGYGITIGNALKRALISSLPGAAVIAFKIKGAQHEFSTVPGIKEDLIEIMMNLKQLSLKVYSDEPVELSVSAKGIKKVKAGDIKKNSSVEIVNKDLVICNLTDKNTALDMKIWVEKGLGYIPVEERKGEKLEIGVMQIDAVYTPVQKVGLSYENVRVGERTDYDKLILDVETDGSITIEDALKQAANILVGQFKSVADLGNTEEVADDGAEKKDDNKAEELSDSEGVGVVEDLEKSDSDEEMGESKDVKDEKKGKPKKKSKAKKD